jgi:hypothetical protein
MKRILKIKLALAISLAVLGAITLPASAQNDGDSNVAIRVYGGSTAKFVATPHSFTTSGYTDFAVNAKLFQGGTASGEFICAIPNVVVLAVVVSNWSQNSDGSVTLTGMEYGYDAVAGAGYADCPASVTLRAGGVGVGGFDFRDCVMGPGQFDTELIRFGSIVIRHRH